MKITIELDTESCCIHDEISALHEIGNCRRLARMLLQNAHNIAMHLAKECTELGESILDNPIVKSIGEQIEIFDKVEEELKVSVKTKPANELPKPPRDVFTPEQEDAIARARQIAEKMKKEANQHAETPTPEPKKEPVILKRHGKYRDKICLDCKKVFTPKSGRQDRCPECREKHLEKLVSEQRARQKTRRHAASVAKKEEEKKPVPPEPVNPTPPPSQPKIISCRRCHKPYIPTVDDKNGYCPKCVAKLQNSPKITPKPVSGFFTVAEVMAMPVVERYKYAYMWTYRERQEALSMKPLGAMTPEEHEFFNRCATGDFASE
jgi:hypothetical protein